MKMHVLTRLISVMTLTAVWGCTAKSERDLKPRTVTLADFAGSTTSPSSRTSEPATGLDVDSSVPELHAATATDTSQALAAPSAKANQPIVIDSVVGQVSGRPIFVEELLEPIADRLRQESQRLNPVEFAEQAKLIVDSRLNDVLLSELFLAESEAALSEQQQVGLIGFLNNFREKTVAEGFGSVAAREKELQEEQGLSVDEYVELEKNRLLIANLINQKIESRVIVSWKDVEREYERRKAQFNPPAAVTLMLIRLSNTVQQEAIAQVRAGLESGQSFEAIAEPIGSPAVRTLEPMTMGAGGISDIEVNEAYKPHLVGLQARQTSPAFEVTNSRGETDTVWLHVKSIDQPAARTLFEVQRQLAQELYQRRKAEQYQRYVKSLFDKGIYSQMQEMSDRVLTVALMRYGQ